jgi:hypothetical protein
VWYTICCRYERPTSKTGTRWSTTRPVFKGKLYHKPSPPVIKLYNYPVFRTKATDLVARRRRKLKKLTASQRKKPDL